MRYATMHRAMEVAIMLANSGHGRCFVIALSDGTFAVGRHGDRRPYIFATL